MTARSALLAALFTAAAFPALAGVAVPELPRLDFMDLPACTAGKPCPPRK